jgi:short-subunit dehydrogenase
MKDKVVIITGASSGIGLATARKFASQGSLLCLGARSIDKLLEVESELKLAGCKVVVVKTDVSVEEDCKMLVDATVKAYGRIDVLINNAGISMRSQFIDTDLKVIKQLMAVNFWGTVYCTKYALPYLIEAKGSLVGVSSIAGFVGLPGRTGYSASKFAMHGFLETLRTENLKTGLHVLIAAPGFTASHIRNSALTADGSPQGDTPREEEKMMTAEEVANHLYKAIVKRKRTMILTFIEGKFSVFLKKVCPRLLDRMTYYYMAKEPNAPIKLH